MKPMSHLIHMAVINAWNATADDNNQWRDLSEEEKICFAVEWGAEKWQVNSKS